MNATLLLRSVGLFSAALFGALSAGALSTDVPYAGVLSVGALSTGALSTDVPYAGVLSTGAPSTGVPSTGAPLKTVVLPGTVTADQVVLFWEKPADYQKIKDYRILLDGKEIGRTKQNFFRVTSLSAATAYSVTISPTGKNIESKEGKITFTTTPAGKRHHVKEYGAKGDGKTIDTKAIQAAIDECSPYGVVDIPKGEYIVGALFVEKDNITIELAKGAVLKAVIDLDAFPVVKTRYEGRERDAYSSVLNIGSLGEKRSKNIRICGQGTIDNQGSILANMQIEARDRSSRSHGLPIINCDDVSIDGITVTNPCTWNVHPIYCKGVTTIEATMLSDKMGLSNADGWNPDSSKDCYLINSVLECHDDHVAIKSGTDAEGRRVGIPSENIFVYHCLFKHGGGIAVGSEMSGGVRNVWFEDLVIENSDRGFHVKSRPGRGGVVENIHFRNIVVERTGRWGISVDMWYYVQEHITGSRKPEEIPTFRGITFENILIKSAQGNPIQVIGLEENPITNILFKNVTIEKNDGEVVLRNCRNITFENVRIKDKHWANNHFE